MSIAALPSYVHLDKNPGYFYFMVRMVFDVLGMDMPFTYPKQLDIYNSINFNRYVVFVKVFNFGGKHQDRWSIKNPENAIFSLPDYVVNDINNFKAHLIIDHSQEAGEAVHLKLLHELCAARKIHNLKNVIYVSQNRALSKVKSLIQYFPADFYFIQIALDIKNEILTEVVEDALNASERNRTKDKKVLCLNATPKMHRLLACAMLEYHGLFDDSIVSFPGTIYAKGSPLDVEGYIKNKIGNLKYLVPSIYNVLNRCPLKVDSYQETGSHLTSKIDISHYKRTWISLVTETAVHPSCIRFTEKTFKCMALGHPFVISNHPRTIFLCKELGFSDFSEVIDHSYDEIDQYDMRLEKLMDSLNKFIYNINSGDNSVFEYINNEANSNRRWLKNGFFKLYYKNFIYPIIKELYETSS
jgi:hypothetical protein